MTASDAPVSVPVRPAWVVPVVVATTVLTLLGVFVLPWFFPPAARQVVSDAQALGFSNRAAEISLVIGCLALAIVALVSGAARRTPQGHAEPVVTLVPCERDERIGPIALLAASVAVVGMVVVVSSTYRSYVFGDAAYFIDRLQYIINGQRLFTDVQFGYGPLLVYPTYWLYLVTRHVGMGLYGAYYLSVAAFQVIGLLFTTYLLNRLRMPKSGRTLMLVVVCAFAMTFLSLGLNYTGVRFLAPFVLTVAALRVSEQRGLPGLLLAPLVAVAVCTLLSPEMGIVALVALGVAFAASALAGKRVRLLGVASALAGILVAMPAFGSSGLGMFESFAAGGAHFPVLLSAVTVIYVATMLVVGWGVGATTDPRDLDPAGPQLGWFAACVVLLAAALGRADFIHLFWNGAAAILLASAFLWTTARRYAAAYPLAIGAVFVSAGIIFAWTGLGTGVVAGAIRSGSLTPTRSVAVARVFGRSQASALATWRLYSVEEPASKDMGWLARQRSVLALYLLHGELGSRLAGSDALAKAYSPPAYLLSRAELDRELEDISRAKLIVIPTAEYREYVSRARMASGMGDDGMRVAPLERTAAHYAGVTGFPLFAQPAFPTLDVFGVIGRELDRHWYVYRTSGGYSFLARLPETP